MKTFDSQNILSDQNLYRAFLGSAFLGLGTLALPALAPIAIGGMISSQAIYWTKQFTQDTPKS